MMGSREAIELVWQRLRDLPKFGVNEPEHEPTMARLPSSYEAAKRALAQCDAIDECKDWADKMAALASYARQAKDEDLLHRRGGYRRGR